MGSATLDDAVLDALDQDDDVLADALLGALGVELLDQGGDVLGASPDLVLVELVGERLVLVRFRVYMSRAPSFTTRILSTPFRFSAMFYPTKINMMSTLIFLMVRSRKALSKSFSRRNLSDSP